MVLNYDMWMVMQHLQKKIKINLEWHKVDSHIGSRIYKNGAKPQGDAYSICLNSQVYIWVGETREKGNLCLNGGPSPQYLYKESSVMVQLRNSQMIYGNISSWVREEIYSRKLIKYLMERNPHWTDDIFRTIG